ncbi:MAG: type II toxin-antitoxin system VapC family toxin [Candidatus Bathyarchaeia archaeon]
MTEYELGNALWKQAKRKGIDFKLAAQAFSEALSELKRISIDSMGDVLTVAVERNLTYYDASYVYIAEKEGLTLVTEDLELVKKCRCAVRTKDAEGIQLV